MPVTVKGTRVQLRNGDWLDLHFRHTGSETITQNNQQYRPQDVLFSYEDVNGLSGIARWVRDINEVLARNRNGDDSLVRTKLVP